MNNAIYGKTLENVREGINFELCSSQTERHTKLASKPQYKKTTIFSEDQGDVEVIKLGVLLITPYLLVKLFLIQAKP